VTATGSANIGGALATLRWDVVRATTTWAVALGCAAITLVVLYPGQYPYDAANQLWQARTQRYGDGSPVAMIAVWSLLLAATGNPASLFVANLALYWVGAVLCAVAIAERLCVRVMVLLLVGLSPLALVQMAHVLTDAHLCAAMMLASGFAAFGLARQRRKFLIAAAATLVYAGCTRYNALFAVVPFGAVTAWAAAPACPERWMRAVKGAAALTLAIVLLASALDRGLVQRRISVWPTLALWDLAAISVASGALLLPPFTHGPGLTVPELEETGAFDPTVNVPLFQRSRSGMRDGYDFPYSPQEKRELLSAWLASIRSHPSAYLHHRMRTFALLVGRHTGPVQATPYFELRIQYMDNPPLPQPAGRQWQATFYRMASELKSSWLFAGLPYVLLASCALVLGWMHRRSRNGAIALAISSSALLYAAAFIPLAPSADLRYLTWPIVAAPLSLAFALSRSRRR
jgi:hypothetical protein